jgi:hypothetical protein
LLSLASGATVTDSMAIQLGEGTAGSNTWETSGYYSLVLDGTGSGAASTSITTAVQTVQNQWGVAHPGAGPGGSIDTEFFGFTVSQHHQYLSRAMQQINSSTENSAQLAHVGGYYGADTNPITAIRLVDATTSTTSLATSPGSCTLIAKHG